MSVKQMQIMSPNSNVEQIDDFLLSALQNPRERLTLLKLDDDLERFMKDTSATRMDFPPMSSYQRLIVHRVAQYFKLEHTAIEIDSQKRAIVLFKTPESRIPEIRFSDLREKEEPPSKTVKIMQRSEDQSGNASGKGKTQEDREGDLKSNSKSSKMKSLEERELEYQKARARIFNGEIPKDNIFSSISEKSEDGEIPIQTEEWSSIGGKDVKSLDTESGRQIEESTTSIHGKKEEKDRLRKKKSAQVTEDRNEQPLHRKDPGRFDNYVEENSWNNPARTSSFWGDNYLEYGECLYSDYNEPSYLANYGPFHNPSTVWGNERYLFQEPIQNSATFGNMTNFPKSFSTPNFHINGYPGTLTSPAENNSSLNRNNPVKSLPRSSWNVPVQPTGDGTRPLSPGLTLNSTWRNPPDSSFRQVSQTMSPHHSNGQISPPHSGNFGYEYQYPESQWSSFYTSSPYMRNGCQTSTSYPQLPSSFSLQNSPYSLPPYVNTNSATTPSTSTTVPIQPSQALPPNSNLPSRQLYDYDRRPPKSTELFDPKASPSDTFAPQPYQRKQQSIPLVNEVRPQNPRARPQNAEKPFYSNKETQTKVNMNMNMNMNNLNPSQYNPNLTVTPVMPNGTPSAIPNGTSSIRMRNTWHQAQHSNVHTMPTSH